MAFSAKLACLAVFSVVISCCFGGDTLSPDNKKIYHDISAGRGLYSGFDKLTNFNASSFRPSVFNSSHNNAWLVEFYNSWCGHCHRFSPVWKQFATDIYGWKDVISVAAVDCSNPLNTPLCRDFEVMFYPLVKYFPPFPSNDFLGFPVKVGSVEQLMETTLKILRQDVAEGTVNQPVLLPYTDRFSNIWNDVPSNVQYIVAITQTNASFLGETMVLDLMKEPNIKVYIVFDNNADVISRLAPTQYPSVFLIDRSNLVSPVVFSDSSRFGVYSAIRSALSIKGIEIPEMKRETVPTDLFVDVSQVMALMEIEDQIKKKLNNTYALSDVVFQVDLERAIRHSLRVEVPAHKIISGEAFTALKTYLNTLIDIFPFGKKGLNYLTYIRNGLEGKTSISGSEFMNIVAISEEKYKPFMSAESGWLGCRGSQARFRGYPCSLWTLFHTLTVHADHARDQDPKRVLRTMLGYIKHFFGCTDCSNHFQEMAKTFEGNVTSTNDAILWLWKAHNSVNNRLKADASEDPMHPKVQFPPESMCRACHYSNGSWNEQIVLPFIKSMYLNISYLTIDDLPPPISTQQTIVASKLVRHENFANEKTFNYSQTDSKPILFNFSIFDVSLFVMLYLFSMAIIILVCVKFLFKKSYRKKTYMYDIFQKV